MTAAAVAVGQTRQTIAASKSRRPVGLRGRKTSRRVSSSTVTTWKRSNQPCHGRGRSSLSSTLQKVSSNWAKMRVGVRKAMTSWTIGLSGATQLTRAKKR